MPGAPKATGPEFDFKTFEGFAAPGSTQVPDIFFDKIMAHLPDVELRVLLYFFRRTFGFKKFSDNISISQMVHGIETRDGKILDYGSGLSKSGVTKGLRGLLKKHLIVATRRSDAKRGNLPTNYALNMQGTRKDHALDGSVGEVLAADEGTQRVPPLSTVGDKGVSPTVHKGSAHHGQALFTSVDTQDTVTNLQTDKVVNGVPRNDHRHPVRDRPTAGRNSFISDRALRSTYRLDEGQIGRVHWLVDRQTEILGSAERNHGYYVKRAAEAVRDGDDGLLDHLLGEFKQAATTIAVESRPAYFHKMCIDAFEKYRREVTLSSVRVPTSVGRHRGPQAISDLFRPPEDKPTDDPRVQMIADAEARGFSVPHYIRTANIPTVNRWWAGLTDDVPSA